MNTAHGDESCGWCDECEADIRARERAAIVAWLRWMDESRGGLWFREYIRCIERGDHLQPRRPAERCLHCKEPLAYRGPGWCSWTCEEADSVRPVDSSFIADRKTINEPMRPDGCTCDGTQSINTCKVHARPGRYKERGAEDSMRPKGSSFLEFARQVGGVPVSQMASGEPVRPKEPDYELSFIGDMPRQPVGCAQCGHEVEDDRRDYAVPTCHACLPPPEPLPVNQPRSMRPVEAFVAFAEKVGAPETSMMAGDPTRPTEPLPHGPDCAIWQDMDGGTSPCTCDDPLMVNEPGDK